MTALEKLQKYKSFPSTLIINGLTDLGVQTAKTLLEQKGLVIMLDKYTEENKKLISELEKFESFAFINLNGNKDLIEKINKLNYIIYLEHENIERNKNLAPKDFLIKISQIQDFFDFALKKGSKVLLTTSLKVHQLSLSEQAKREYDPKASSYTDIEEQRYIEKLAFDLHKKYDLNVRAVRLGEVYGLGCTLPAESNLRNLIEQSIKSKYIKIYGDGLEDNFFIHIKDATYGLIKALFSPNTNGEIFNLTNFEEASTLSIVYALLETNGKAKEVKFLNAKTSKITSPIDITPNLSKIGWAPRISLINGLSEVVSDAMGFGMKEIKREKVVIKDTSNSIWTKIHNFFFITEEQFQLQQKQKKKKKVLEKLSKETVEKNRVKTDEKLAEKIVEKKKDERKLIKKSQKRALIRKIKLGWKKNLILFSLATLSYIFIFAPLIGLIGNLLLASYNGYQAVEDLKENNYTKLEVRLGRIESNIGKAQSSLDSLKWIAKAVKKESYTENLSTLFASIRHLARGGQYSLELIEPMVNYGKEFTLNTGSDKSYESYMEEIRSNAREFDMAYIEIIKANQLIGDVDFSKLPFSANQKSTIQNLQGELYNRIINYKDFISVLPSILGYPESKKYLLLFQNDFEIRSTGGFIGSYGLVTLDKGKVTEIKVDDIYNPDGQLKTFVEPPEALKVLLGDTSWAMRDANWEPDFPTSAKQIEWFYNLETEDPVDGVIAINTSTIRSLLEITGGVTLDDGDTITLENFFEKAEAHHETFTPGSTEKKDFLGDLATKMLEKLGQKDTETLLQVSLKIEELLKNREVFIYLNNASAQKIISKNEWDGKIKEQDGEYLFVVENNISGNKVNKYLERKISQNINLSENSAVNNLTIDYTNNSQTGGWPGGNYYSFVQIFIPLGADNLQVIGLEDYQTEDKYNYKVVSGTINVPYNNKYTVNISYTSETVKDKPVSKKVYSHLIQKQSGINDTYLDIQISYPSTWRILKNESNIASQPTTAENPSYYGKQNEDSYIDLEFSTEK